jgi:hypothetical protein
MKKSTLIYLSIISILFTAVLYLLYLNFNRTQTTSIPATVDTPPETSDPITDWEIFNDTQFGISFYYPKDWSVTKETNGLFIISPETSNNILDANNTWTRVGDIIIQKITKDKLPNNKNNLPLTQWISSEEAKNYGINQPAAPYNLGGLTGYKVISCGEMCGEEVYLESSDIIYRIDSGNYDRFTGIFSQILSTFKFTDTQSSTGNWIKRQNGDFETNDNCLWIDTSKANDNGALESYIERILPGTTIATLLYKTQYKVDGSQTITISPQGVGELFTVYFSKDDKKYSITFHSASQDNVIGQDNCSNFQEEVDFVLNNPELFI